MSEDALSMSRAMVSKGVEREKAEAIAEQIVRHSENATQSALDNLKEAMTLRFNIVFTLLVALIIAVLSN